MDGRSADAGPLGGRVAMVTGGSRGIGRAIALRFARDGLRVAITYRRREDLARETVATIERAGGQARALPLDLTEPSRVPEAIDAIGGTWGRIDVLVANAAATAFRPLVEQRPHNVRLTLAVSVESFVAAVTAALPFMRGRPGRVIAISGIDSFQAMTGHGVLGAAKAAVESLVRAFALELGPQGVTVNGVNPGIVDTDSSRLYFTRGVERGFDDVAAAALRAATPVRRLGTADDVASLVAWIASDEASFLTGQTIVLDGGLTIVSPTTSLTRPA